ncbi:sensor histidine kinase [Sutcliffiella halmapala]|uniref:sensor histidine kinase n=1 Tax=Sutcliffiella halmapala TaxID=79882 RepID=UPI000995D370|nr:HAMP domain-containing sensor histidine kinase [Sutcliffiella halmapala]
MRSLYSKFVLFTLVIMIVSALLAFFLSNAYYQHVLKSQNDEKYTNISLNIAQYINTETNLELAKYFELLSNIGYQLMIVDTNGEAVFYGTSFRKDNLQADVIEPVLNGEIYHGMARFPKDTFVTGFFANETKNSIGVAIEHNDNKYAMFLRPNLKLLFNEMHFLFAWLLTLTVVFSLIFEITLAKYLIHPLSKLNKATKLVQIGKYPVVLSVNRKDEIGELASSFQDMSKQLAQLDDMRNEFISNISHDIQSPLSNIKGYASLLEKASLKKEEEEYLTVIQQEADRLSSLTSQLLTISNLNQLKELRIEEEVHIAQQLKELMKKYQWKLSEKEISIQLLLKDVTIKGDSSLLLSMWDNLLSNAIKYNKQEGSIAIAIQTIKDSIEVTFKDTGIGLTSEQKGKIFDRFYRADVSRSSNVEGSGLGLAIVRKIVELHRGTITIQSKLNEGTTITVILPDKKM